jgi:G3E family GTPase
MKHCNYSLWVLVAVSIRSLAALSTAPWTTANAAQQQIPITVVAGFLGAGKTSLVQCLLENNQGLRIAIVVNDVASVNIDSKLLSSKAAAAGMVELQNGCACCSLSEELLTSVSELVTLSDLRGDDQGFHHIVIELSGVADPKSVRSKFQEAKLYDMPLLERVRLDTMVTLVDASVFLGQMKNSKRANAQDSPELFYPNGQIPAIEEEWPEDIPPLLLEALQAGERSYSARTPELDSGVVDLLVSQCEIADVVLINKVDLVNNNGILQRTRDIVKALNPRATILETNFGNLPLQKVLGVAEARGVVEAGIVDDHKDSIKAADSHSSTTEQKPHDHSCSEPDCVDVSHSHGHHEHSSDSSKSTDSYVSGHHHDDQAIDCADPDCNDTSHSHEHSVHGNLGSFVYRARRPFHPGRLVRFLQRLPVSRGVPEGVVTGGPQITVDETVEQILNGVLRSKGFMWNADSNVAAMFWSQAGTSFELSCLGRWWATLDRSEWPAEAVAAILEDFDDATHNENDLLITTVGDRRQEVVFIGSDLDRDSNQRVIIQALNQCLLNDDEWNVYCARRTDEPSLRSLFPNPLQAKVMSY